jgi:pre-mRNA-processing factor 39
VKLVEASQTQEGGLNRNSHPQAIAATRETFDYLLARFPLFFGFWKKYADLEFTIGGPEAAEMVSPICTMRSSTALTANRYMSEASLA